MRAFLISLGLFIISVMAFLWVGPYFVDWSDHRLSFANALGKFTQREVRVEGDLRVRLLPTPAVEVSQVTIGRRVSEEQPATVNQNASAGEGEGELLSFAQLTVTLELGALLRGELRATSAMLDEPVLHLVSRDDGSENWRTSLNPESGLAFFDELVIDNLEISDGVVRLDDGSGAPTELLIRNANISAGSIDGPYLMRGTMAVPVSPADDANFTLTVGTVSEGEAELSIAFGIPSGALEGSLRGNINFAGEVTAIEGTVQAAMRGESLDMLVGVGAPPEWTGLDLVYRSNIYRDSERFSLEDMEWITPWGTLRGELSYFGQDQSIVADVSSLRLRRSPAPSAATEANAQAQNIAPQNIEGTQDEPAQMLVMMYQAMSRLQSAGTKGDVSLAVNSIDMGDGRVADVRIEARLAEQGIIISNASARAPGGTEATFSGLFVNDERAGEYWRGEVAGTSQSLATLLNWVAPHATHLTPSLSIDGPGEVGYSASVDWSQRAIEISDITVAQGEQSVSGAVTITLGDEPAVDIDLSTAFFEWEVIGGGTGRATPLRAPSVQLPQSPLPARLRLIIEGEQEANNATGSGEDSSEDVAAGGTADASAQAQLLWHEKPLFVRELGDLLGGIGAGIGLPVRFTYSTDKVLLAGNDIASLKLQAELDEQAVDLSIFSLRGKGGLLVQISGRVSLADDNQFELRASAAGSSVQSALDAIAIAGVASAAQQSDDLPGGAVAPFSLLANWSRSGVGSSISVSGNLGGSEVTYAFASEAVQADSEGGQNEQEFVLFHPDLKVLLTNWEVPVPNNLANNQAINLRVSAVPHADDQQRLVADITSGELRAQLNALASWSAAGSMFPSNFSGELSARGRDPRWWVNVFLPTLGAQMGGAAREEPLPYRINCAIAYADNLLSGRNCDATVASSRANARFDYAFAAAPSAQDSGVDAVSNPRERARLEFELTADAINIASLAFVSTPVTSNPFFGLPEGAEDGAAIGETAIGETATGEEGTDAQAGASSDGETQAPPVPPQLSSRAARLADLYGITGVEAPQWRSDAWVGSLPADVDINGEINVGTLTIAPDVELIDFSAEVLLADNLRLSNASALWRDGPASVDAVIGLTEGVMWLESSFSIAPAGEYVMAGESVSGEQLSVSSSPRVQGRVSTQGTSLKSMSENLTGRGRLSLNNTVITGIDPIAVERAYFAAVRGSDANQLNASAPFAAQEIVVGDMVGEWSASDGLFRYSAPGNGSEVQRLRADFDLPLLKRVTEIRMLTEQGRLPGYSLEMRDQVSSLMDNPPPLLASVDLSEVRQKLLVTLTENTVLTLEQFSLGDEEIAGGETMEEVRTPQQLAPVEVEALSDDF